MTTALAPCPYCRVPPEVVSRPTSPLDPETQTYLAWRAQARCPQCPECAKPWDGFSQSEAKGSAVKAWIERFGVVDPDATVRADPSQTVTRCPRCGCYEAPHCAEVPDPGDARCPDCNGDTIRFRGSGLDLERWVCPRWQEPGHLSREAINERVREERARHMPRSGRWA